MPLALDHVTVAGRSLDLLSEAFESAGLPPTYGGTHSNRVTHMATLSLPDDIYVELVSTREPGASSPWWDASIRTDAGPCAWCVQVDDVATAADRFAKRGIDVDGPHEFARERPDGTRLEWKLLYLGAGEPGSTLPFCIEDTTPREWRVGKPETNLGVTGIECVVLGVHNRDTVVSKLRDAFALSVPTQTKSARLGATVAHFPTAPVAVAEPAENGWLSTRLATVGESPCAYLFSSEADHPPQIQTDTMESWGDQTLSWIAPERIGGVQHLGVVE